MVSTQRQVDAGSSLEAQQRICEEWAKNNKHTVVAIFMDQGQSAKETSIKKRPQLLEMLEEAKGKSFDLLVIHKLDRLSRSLRDTLTLMSTLDTYGVKLVSVNEQYDFSTAIGKMTFVMLMSFAEFYLNNLSGEIRKGNLERAIQGYWHGKTPPVGYRYDKTIRLLVIHEKEALLVHRGFELCAENKQSLEGICAQLKQEGLGVYDADGNIKSYLYPVTLRWMLHNRIYTGDVVINEPGKRVLMWFKPTNTVYPGKHKAIVTHEIFMKVDAILKANANSGRGAHMKSKHRVFGSGFMRCTHCGTIMSPGGGGNSGRKIYGPDGKEFGERLFSYICKSGKYGKECDAKRKSVSARLVMEEMSRVISLIELSEASRAKVRASALMSTDSDVNADKRDSLIRRRNRIRDIYENDGYTLDEYKAKDKALIEELSRLPVLQVSPGQILGAQETITEVQKLWNGGTDIEKRDLLRLMFLGINFDPDEIQIVSIRLQPQFMPLFDTAPDGLYYPPAAIEKPFGYKPPYKAQSSRRKTSS